MYFGTSTRKITRKEFQVMFLRKKTESNHFVFPDTINMSDVNINDIVRKLPKPVTVGEAGILKSFLKLSTGLNLFYVT